MNDACFHWPNLIEFVKASYFSLDKAQSWFSHKVDLWFCNDLWARNSRSDRSLNDTNEGAWCGAKGEKEDKERVNHNSDSPVIVVVM